MLNATLLTNAKEPIKSTRDNIICTRSHLYVEIRMKALTAGCVCFYFDSTSVLSFPLDSSQVHSGPAHWAEDDEDDEDDEDSLT